MSKLIIPSQNLLRFVSKSEIILCKSDNCYVSVHLQNGEEFVLCKSLKKLTLELNSSLFIQVSQSFLINKDFIKIIDKKNKHIEMENRLFIPFTVPIKTLTALITGLAR